MRERSLRSGILACKGWDVVVWGAFYLLGSSMIIEEFPNYYGVNEA